MSEAGHQATSVLLPTSGVTIYTKDPDTRAAAQNVQKDWRFARVDVQIKDGDVEAAISTYEEFASPDLVIIQTDTIDDSFTDRLGVLAGHCNEGTSAIVIGPVNDVNLYRTLIEMGVNDYLVRPIESSVLADVIAKTLIGKIGATGSRLIAFIGSKGGVGTSILAQASACGLSEILGQKTMLLDTSGGWSTASVSLGFEPTTTLQEATRAAAANDEDSLNRMLFQAGEKLSILASGGEVMLEPALGAEQLEELVNTLMVKYPVVIVDLSQSPETLRKMILTRANQTVLVSTPTLSALRLGRSLIQEVKDIRGSDDTSVDLVINMQGCAPAHEVSKSDITASMECKIAASIPFQPKIFLGNENESRKLTDSAEGKEIILQFLLPLFERTLAVKLEKVPPSPEKAGIMGGLLRKLSTKLR